MIENVISNNVANDLLGSTKRSFARCFGFLILENSA